MKRLILVTSDEPWSEVWHTQLHYAWQLSGRNKVYYVQPPVKWKFSNLWDWRLTTETVHENLFLIRYVNVLPASLGFLAILLNDLLNTFRFNRIRDIKSKTELLVWHFDPMRSFSLFRNRPFTRHIYHVVDPYAGQMLDRRLASISELVIVTSPKFVDHYKSINQNVMLIRQGVDIDFYKQQLALLANKKVTDKKILLIGTLTDDVDIEMLGNLSKENQKYRFLFIGPDKFRSSQKRNVFNDGLAKSYFEWMGPMKPVDFMPFLASCGFGIIAYHAHDDSVNHLRSPLKVITYLAAGKPVITNIDCEIPELLGKGIYMAASNSDFRILIDRALDGGLAIDTQAVDTYLKSVTYSNLLSQIFSNIDSKGRSDG